jgi:hypothetical protein
MTAEEFKRIKVILSNLRYLPTADSIVPSQNEDGVTQLYFKISEDLFLQITKECDSYGDNECVSGIQFVKPKRIEITEWETV